MNTIHLESLISVGLDESRAKKLLQFLQSLSNQSPKQIWQSLSAELSHYPYHFPLHLYLFTTLFPDWHEHPDTAPAWSPTPDEIQSSHLYQFMQEFKLPDYPALHRFSTQQSADFWQTVIKKLNIVFKQPPQQIFDIQAGIESIEWLPGSLLNIADSCFNAAANKTALVYLDHDRLIKKMSYAELNRLTNLIANGLLENGLKVGDAIAIAMPMNEYAVAIYLAILKMGGVVVSIADSFSRQEMATRLRIAKAKAIFTQDFTDWSTKPLPLYEKVKSAFAEKIIVLAMNKQQIQTPLRAQDLSWEKFLSTQAEFTSYPCTAMSACNILFSSGTTAEPKAIIWNHTTAIKAASDAYFHQDVKETDVIAWPTNLGWMMGPWLIFAGLINQACIALYPYAPKDQAFGRFIQDAKVTILGVVPTLVASWRQSHCMEGLNWQAIKLFSSTGECSNPEDMLYLMSLAAYKPIIEYCGGTEIGGAYITSTLLHDNYPSLLSTPALGSDFLILDEQGLPAVSGEVAIIPPSMGLSTQLLNANHHEVYFAHMPKNADGKQLRRHGDAIQCLPNHYYCLLGRADDTMKLSGIKVSSAEIERAILGIAGISEVAAVAVALHNKGPSQLIIYAVSEEQPDKQATLALMQKRINTQLNPLFKIYDLCYVKELPKTASNKIMRRYLRQLYQENN